MSRERRVPFPTPDGPQITTGRESPRRLSAPEWLPNVEASHESGVPEACRQTRPMPIADERLKTRGMARTRCT
eukprot:scaffold254907_cov31-Tisochrysis_lutea.AAC.3